LRETDLKGAQLQQANLYDAELHTAHLRDALCDGATVWPHGFAWRDAGVKLDTE
jgi:uncharacterized protein YjbI with pentapeptide repeats